MVGVFLYLEVRIICLERESLRKGGRMLKGKVRVVNFVEVLRMVIDFMGCFLGEIGRFFGKKMYVF